MAAAALIWWSITAIQQRRLIPANLPAWPLGLTGVMLLAYWLMRLALSFGQGVWGFPGFPVTN